MEEISRLAEEEGAAQDSKGAASPKVPFTVHPRFALFQLLILSNSLPFASLSMSVALSGCSSVGGGDACGYAH